jgi:hypothetical protein
LHPQAIWLNYMQDGDQAYFVCIRRFRSAIER